MFQTFMFELQNDILYSPNVELTRNPSDFDIPYRDIVLPTRDGEHLHVWWIRNRLNVIDAPILIYFHGTHGNMGTRLEFINECYKNLNVNVLAVDYRGFGYSTGQPSESGLQTDAETVMNFVVSEWKNSKIIVLGHSMGGAVALYLSSMYPERISMTIVENTFSELSIAVDELYPWLKIVRPMILQNEWNNMKRILKINHPILFLSGTDDRRVLCYHTERLMSQSPSVAKRHVSIQGGEHTSWTTDPVLYFTTVSSFIEEHLAYIRV